MNKRRKHTTCIDCIDMREENGRRTGQFNLKNKVNKGSRDKSKHREINEEHREKKTQKRQGTKNKVNKPTIIGMVQLEE